MSDTQEQTAASTAETAQTATGTPADTQAAAAATPTTNQSVQSVIYCGPTLPRQHGLTQYRIFNNGLPDHVDQLIVVCPAIKSLIVPVDQLAQTRISISTKGNALSVLYQQIVTAFANKAVKK